jgi:hypothetical protein
MNLHTASSVQYQILRAMLLLAVTLLFTACSIDEKLPAAGSTGREASNAEAASTGFVPLEVAEDIDQVTSQPRYEHSSWGFSSGTSRRERFCLISWAKRCSCLVPSSRRSA